MTVRNAGRFVAFGALVAVVVAVLLVVRVGLNHTPHTTTSARSAQSTVVRRSAPKHRFYTIKTGDSLSSISLKTGVPLSTLESLNSSVDPNALQAGHRLRLR
jgi:LysM repeat protein